MKENSTFIGSKGFMNTAGENLFNYIVVGGLYETPIDLNYLGNHYMFYISYINDLKSYHEFYYISINLQDQTQYEDTGN